MIREQCLDKLPVKPQIVQDRTLYGLCVAEGIHRAVVITLAARVPASSCGYSLKGGDICIRSGQAATNTHKSIDTTRHINYNVVAACPEAHAV